MKRIDTFPIISDQVTKVELRQILSAFKGVLEAGVGGDIVELGCYVGTTSLFLQRMIAQYDTPKQLHVYDSFEGLPEKSASDSSPAGEQFKAGELKATRRELVRHFKQAGLQPPIIHKAWFSELSPGDMPEQISFAFLDGDFYDSILDSLRLVWPRLTDGAVVVVDDYQSEALPGVRRAIDEWLRERPAQLRVVASLAIIQP